MSRFDFRQPHLLAILRENLPWPRLNVRKRYGGARSRNVRMKWYRILVPFCVLAILAVGCAAPHVSLDPIPASPGRNADSAIFSVKKVGWIDLGRSGSELLMELSIANTTGRAALLSPDSLEAVFRPDPIGKRPCAEILSRPVDFRKREERLVAAARVEHDPANPYDPDGLGLLYHGLSHSSKFDRKLSEYSPGRNGRKLSGTRSMEAR